VSYQAYDPQAMLEGIADKFREAIYISSTLMEGRDKHLIFTLSGLPIEPNLIVARSILRLMEKRARTNGFKMLLRQLREELEMDMDAYANIPIPVDSIVKGKPKPGREMPVISRYKVKDMDRTFLEERFKKDNDNIHNGE